MFLVTPLLIGPVCLLSQGRFEEPVTHHHARRQFIITSRSRRRSLCRYCQKDICWGASTSVVDEVAAFPIWDDRPARHRTQSQALCLWDCHTSPPPLTACAGSSVWRCAVVGIGDQAIRPPSSSNVFAVV